MMIKKGNKIKKKKVDVVDFILVICMYNIHILISIWKY